MGDNIRWSPRDYISTGKGKGHINHCGHGSANERRCYILKSDWLGPYQEWSLCLVCESPQKCWDESIDMVLAYPWFLLHICNQVIWYMNKMRHWLEWFRMIQCLSRLKMLNSSPVGIEYKRQWIESAMVQIMACHLFGAKALSKLMLGYCQLDPCEYNSVKFQSKYETFYSRKSSWKYHLRNGSHFVPEEMSWSLVCGCWVQ